MYATKLHNAPCHFDSKKVLGILIALPMGTKTDKPEITPITQEDHMLWARNKWVLACPDKEEAKSDTHIGLTGGNIDIIRYIENRSVKLLMYP